MAQRFYLEGRGGRDLRSELSPYGFTRAWDPTRKAVGRGRHLLFVRLSAGSEESVIRKRAVYMWHIITPPLNRAAAQTKEPKGPRESVA